MSLASHHALRPLLDWWGGSVTHGDFIWLALVVGVYLAVAYAARRVHDVWAERIRVRRRPAGVLDVRILGSASQVEAAMRAWLERGKHDGSGG